MPEPGLVRVQFQPVGRRVEVPAGSTVYETARQAGVALTSACGGTGKCGLCKVGLVSGAARGADGRDGDALTPEEAFLLDPAEQADGLRLACRVHVHRDTVVRVPRPSMVTGQRLQVDADLQEIPPEPLVRAHDVELAAPSLKDPRADLTRLVDALPETGRTASADVAPRADIAVLRGLSPRLRELGWRATAYLRGGDAPELVGVAAPGSPALGVAVDLGTTKVAAQLVDLATGEVVASASAPNPEISYGEDVVSRLEKAYRSADQARELARLCGATLEDLVGTMTAEAGRSRDQVVDAVVVGNTAMTHLLLTLPVAQLVKAPFVGVSSGAVELPAAELGLTLAPGARVHSPPAIGGFVGADHVAMTLAAQVASRDLVTIGVDIGTNTEIMLHRADLGRSTATSCPSGPAFEGAHVKDGMRAATGAVEKVRIEDGRVEVVTIDHAPAVGICGSGILDAVAQLHRAGILNDRGRMQRSHPAVSDEGHGAQVTLVEADRTGVGRPIVVTQRDVNEIQLAKGAIRAGIDVLLETTGTAPELVDEVVIAGAFGSFLSVASALSVGMFPALPRARFRQVGNAALVGARWMLVSRAARAAARDLATRSDYVELTTYPGFNRGFALAMLLPPTPKEDS